MKVQALTLEELAHIRAHLADSANTYALRDACLFEVGIIMGLRIQELVTLDIGHVWTNGIGPADLEVSTAMGGTPRRIPLTEAACL